MQKYLKMDLTSETLYFVWRRLIRRVKIENCKVFMFLLNLLTILHYILTRLRILQYYSTCRKIKKNTYDFVVE
jgi:hypothetical protein